MKNISAGIVIPGILAVVGIAALALWLGMPLTEELKARVPGLDDAPPPRPVRATERPVQGQPIRSNGRPSQLAGSWPWFRGENLDGICDDGIRLARRWPPGGPKKLWEIQLGEGFASAAISGGCVYVLDYVPDEEVEQLRDLEHRERVELADALSSLSADTSEELDRVLRKLYPVEGHTGADPPRIVSQEEYDAIKAAVRSLYAEKPDKLLATLRYEMAEDHELPPDLQRPSLDDVDRSSDVMRCLSLDDGREIWRNGYRVMVSSNHGMSRTVPAVIGKYVISIGPRCHVACWDAETGEGYWLLDLVRDYGATVPPWYAGQCPLIDVKTERPQLVLAPAGKALLMAVDYETGKVLWESDKPQGWEMTHASITPMDFGGRRMYVYPATGGVAGVAADDGSILWQTTDWTMDYATTPAPVILDGGRILLTSGYRSASVILQVRDRGGQFAVETFAHLTRRQFGGEQHTPVLFDGYLYAVRKNDKRLVCLDQAGNEVWNSGAEKFGKQGMAPYMIADGLIYVMSDDGWLTMAEATPKGYRPLPGGKAQVIEDGHDSWGPMALVAGRLIVRDMTRMVCLDVAEK